MDKVYLAVVAFDYEGEPPIGIYSDLDKAKAGIAEYCMKYPESDIVEWGEWIGTDGIPYMRGFCDGSKFYIYEIPLNKYIY